jgi:hypothetical protein
MTDKIIKREIMHPVRHRWMCGVGICQGEMKGTGEGFTQLSTQWKNCCTVCGREEWADYSYPKIKFEPVDTQVLTLSDLSTPTETRKI